MYCHYLIKPTIQTYLEEHLHSGSFKVSCPSQIVTTLQTRLGQAIPEHTLTVYLLKQNLTTKVKSRTYVMRYNSTRGRQRSIRGFVEVKQISWFRYLGYKLFGK